MNFHYGRKKKSPSSSVEALDVAEGGGKGGRSTHAFTRKTRNILLHINQQFALILNLSQQKGDGEVPALGFVTVLQLDLSPKVRKQT